MIYNHEKQCCTNDDGSKIVSSWVKTGYGKNTHSELWSCSMAAWSNTRYAKYLVDGLKDSDKETINNSHLWTH